MALEYDGGESKDVIAGRPSDEKDDENETASGEDQQDAQEAAGEEPARKEDSPSAEDLLGGLADYSLTLANAVSSGDVEVYTIYVADGTAIDRQLLSNALSGGSGKDIVLVNIVAENGGQTLALPAAGGPGAEHVIYNIVAEGSGRAGDYFAPFTGKLELTERGAGTYLAPEGSVQAGSGLTGAAYAYKVATDGAKIAKAVVIEPEERTEAAETEAEEASETAEIGIEEVTETEETTEAETEVIDAESEADSEQETDTEEEADSEENLDTAELAAPVDTLNVAKKDDLDGVVTGARLTLFANEDIIASEKITVKDKNGKDVTFEKDATAYKDGTEIYSWISGETAVNIGSYLVPAGTYRIVETDTPTENIPAGYTGYAKAGDFYFTVGPDGKVKNEAGDTITAITMIDGLVGAADDSLLLR